MSDCTSHSPTAYLKELARGVEAWTAQGVSLAITGGRWSEPTGNQPYEKAWPEHPIRNVGDFWSHVDAVTFEVRGIAAIHGLDYGTFALDMDKEMGRSDFEWLTSNGYITDDDLIVDSPDGHHVILRHDDRIARGHVAHPEGDRRFVTLDGFDGPRGDGTLHATLRGRARANVTKLPPTRRPGTDAQYTSRHGWQWDPQPLPAWVRFPKRPTRMQTGGKLVGVPMAGSVSNYGEAALVGEVETLIGTRPGGRNEQLNISALKLGSLCAIGALDLERVTMALFAASERNGLVEDKGAHSVWATIRSGLSAGIASPRGVTS